MSKATHDTPRQQIQQLTDIVNIGPATRDDLVRVGISRPQQLIDRDPLKLYRQVCDLNRMRYDPCVLDVFMSAIDFMNGNPPKKWWDYTALRKTTYGKL